MLLHPAHQQGMLKICPYLWSRVFTRLYQIVQVQSHQTTGLISKKKKISVPMCRFKLQSGYLCWFCSSGLLLIMCPAQVCEEHILQQIMILLAACLKVFFLVFICHQSRFFSETKKLVASTFCVGYVMLFLPICIFIHSIKSLWMFFFIIRTSCFSVFIQN